MTLADGVRGRDDVDTSVSRGGLRDGRGRKRPLSDPARGFDKGFRSFLDNRVRCAPPLLPALRRFFEAHGGDEFFLFFFDSYDPHASLSRLHPVTIAPSLGPDNNGTAGRGTESSNFGGSRLRVSSFSELSSGHSILRSETTVALSRLHFPAWDRPCVLDAGGPTARVWDAMAIPGFHAAFSLNSSAARKPDVIGDLDSSWPIRSGTLDLIVSSYVLEHLRKPGLFFRESFRALRQGGVLVLTTVLIHQKHGSPRDYFRFTDEGLVTLARDAGYEVETMALLAGPGQCIAALLSSFLVFPWIRIVALLAARASDWLIKRVLPFVQENWCAGYVVMARKPFETPKGQSPA